MINSNKSNEIGLMQDYVNVPFVSGVNSILAHLNTSYYHVHGASFIYPKYANPVTLTSAAASWATTGAIVEVIPANAITKAFDIHWCSTVETSADLFGIIDIFSGAPGAEVLIGAIDVYRGSAQGRDYPMPVQIPQQAANTRISCRFSDSTTSARTIGVKFYGHVYDTSL